MDEDVEFRDMVLRKLEENGSLLQIKAQLRAHLYNVIENDGKTADVVNDSDLSYANADKSELQEEENGTPVDGETLALGLVCDLLESLKLTYTKQVFLAEAGIKRPCLSRERLRKELLKEGGTASDDDAVAVLHQLVEQSRRIATSGNDDSDVSQVSKEISESETVTEDSSAVNL